MNRTSMLMAVLLVALGVNAAAQSIRKGTTPSGIAYDMQGSGPVVVLLTGSNLDRRMWAREAAWLSKTHTVVRYDLRAHGESDTATREFTHLGDLVAVLDQLTIQTATLIGLSAGSTLHFARASGDAPTAKKSTATCANSSTCMPSRPGAMLQTCARMSAASVAKLLSMTARSRGCCVVPATKIQ